jgi:hypothetical protein
MNPTNTRSFNTMSHEFSRLIRNEYDMSGTIFDLSSYISSNSIETIRDNSGNSYVLDGDRIEGFKGKLKTANPEKPKSCPSEKWAFQGGCWPFKRSGTCKHMEEALVNA